MLSTLMRPRPLLLLVVALLALGIYVARPVSGARPTSSSASDGDRVADTAAVRDADLPPPLTCRPDLLEGERLVYELRWSGLPAGRAVMSVHWREPVDGATAWLVRARVTSNRLLSAMYPVDSDYRTLIDTRGGFSRYFYRRQNEGRIVRERQVRFDYDTRQALSSPLAQSAFGAVDEQKVRLIGPAQDPLSILYALRSVDLTEQDQVALRVHDIGRDWAMVLKVVGTRELDLGRLGKRMVREVRCNYAFPGLFVRRGPVTLYLDPATNVVLAISAETPVGPMMAALVSAENSPLQTQETAAKNAGSASRQ